MTDRDAAYRSILDTLGVDARRARWSPAGSSALNATRRLEAGAARYFVKLGAPASLPMYEAEAAGLRALGAANAVRVPTPIITGSGQGAAWLVLEWLDLTSRGRDAELGRALAALHRVAAARFGWERDNTIGTTPQQNAWLDDWSSFVRDRRIGPQVVLAGSRGYHDVAREGERLLSRISALLAGHSPEASLLHGDLWSGNAAALRGGEPVIFDPATYHGDREADLAMTELFGGFEASFYAAYREAWPLPAGYATRRTLYNVYHVLNHLNLFGGAYAGQALRMIASLLAEARA